jgi:hypothetical protein
VNHFAILLTAILSAITISLASAEPSSTVNEAALKEELVKLEKQSWEAWKNRDGKFFQNFLSDDHVEVGFSGIAQKRDIVEFVASPVCTVKSYQLDNFEMKLLNQNTALLTYREAQDTMCNKAVPSPCWVSSLYMKREGRWQNVLYQQSQISK